MKVKGSEDLASRKKYLISSADCDIEGRVRLGALSNLLIQSAINSAESLGFGFKGLQQEKLFWVLSRMTVELVNPPLWGDEVEVETWPKDINGLLYIRDFLIRDRNNQIITRATTGWLAIDFKSKRPRKIESIYMEYYTHLKDRHAIQAPPLKLGQVSEGKDQTIISSYFDFDLNRHVTSTRYLDWMMDSFSFDFHKKNYPKKFSVNYLREIFPGESIRMRKCCSNQKQYLFEGLNLEQNRPAFKGVIDF